MRPCVRRSRRSCHRRWAEYSCRGESWWLRILPCRSREQRYFSLGKTFRRVDRDLGHKSAVTASRGGSALSKKLLYGCKLSRPAFRRDVFPDARGPAMALLRPELVPEPR